MSAGAAGAAGKGNGGTNPSTGGAAGKGAGGASPSGGASGQSNGGVAGTSSAGMAGAGGVIPSDAGVDAPLDAPIDAPVGFGASCSYNSDCKDSELVCKSGSCAYECLTSDDCASGRICTSHRCSLEIPDGSNDAYGSPCNVTSDCQGGLVCGKGGYCVDQCEVDYDCKISFGSEYCCSPASHQCVVTIGGACAVATPDAGPSDAGGDGGCSADLDCQDDQLCNGFERCVAGSCYPSALAACDDGDPCTQDTCDESTKKCSHGTIGPVDADGDGHFASACGGSADDCDDTNPNVYTGHPEICDFVDNNCNGQVDEGLWSVGVPTTVSEDGTTNTYDPIDGAPAVARFADGTFAVVAPPTGIGPSFSVSQLNAWKLSASLAKTSGPVSIAGEMDMPACGSVKTFWASAATDGTTLGAGASFGHGSSCIAIDDVTAAVAKSDLTNPVSTIIASSSNGWTPWVGVLGSAPIVRWNGSRFVLAWADNSETLASAGNRLRTAVMTSAGVVSGAHDLSNDPTEITLDINAPWLRIAMAVTPTSGFVAWRIKGGGIRWEITDESLQAPLVGPITPTSMSGDPSWDVGSAAHVGSSYFLVGQDDTGTMLRVWRIDDQTGAEVASIDVANPGGMAQVVLKAEPYLSAVGKGIMLTYASPSSIFVAVAREDLVGGFASTSFAVSNTTGAQMAAVDATHMAISWADTGVHAAMVTCGELGDCRGFLEECV